MNNEMTSVQSLFDAFDSEEQEILSDFFKYLEFKSISTESQYAPDVKECVSWLAKYIQSFGMTADIWETERHPILYAEWLGAGEGKPTLLFYGHYDVQPVDPVELWNSPPFEPQIREGEVYARGAVDNKGQNFYIITALKYLLRTKGSLPINVKLCIEGEEEAGSVSLSKALIARAKQLSANYLAIVDTGFHHVDEPAVTLGVRGIIHMSLELRGSNTDLHSGSHGGIVMNPNHAMVELLSKLRDSQGKVLVPGFYDDIIALTESERAELSFDFDEEYYLTTFGAKPVGGECQYEPLESAWLRPTLEINGISGGYAGDGFKTVIPGVSVAKISCRLVPGQEPEKIERAVADYLNANVPLGVSLSIEVHEGGGPAVRTGPSSKIVQATRQAFSDVFDKPCKYILEGGSIPIVSDLANSTGAEPVLMGYGLPDDAMHAPNEHFGVGRLRKGFATICRMLDILAKD